MKKYSRNLDHRYITHFNHNKFLFNNFIQKAWYATEKHMDDDDFCNHFEIVFDKVRNEKLAIVSKDRALKKQPFFDTQFKTQIANNILILYQEKNYFVYGHKKNIDEINKKIDHIMENITAIYNGQPLSVTICCILPGMIPSIPLFGHILMLHEQHVLVNLGWLILCPPAALTLLGTFLAITIGIPIFSYNFFTSVSRLLIKWDHFNATNPLKFMCSKDIYMKEEIAI